MHGRRRGPPVGVKEMLCLALFVLLVSTKRKSGLTTSHQNFIYIHWIISPFRLSILGWVLVLEVGGFHL